MRSSLDFFLINLNWECGFVLGFVSLILRERENALLFRGHAPRSLARSTEISKIELGIGKKGRARMPSNQSLEERARAVKAKGPYNYDVHTEGKGGLKMHLFGGCSL